MMFWWQYYPINKKWKAIDEELFNLPQGSRVAVYYKDIRFNRYHMIMSYKNDYFNRESWKETIMDAFDDKEAKCYCIIDLPEVPEEFK